MPLVAYVSRRASAEKIASREFSSAQTTASPPGFVRICSEICSAGEPSLAPWPPGQPTSLVAGGAVVRVGAADEAEAEGVHAELLLEAESGLERRPDEVASRILVDRDVGRVRPLVRMRILLEGTELVGGADPGARQAIEAALRVALDLMELDERL